MENTRGSTKNGSAAADEYELGCDVLEPATAVFTDDDGGDVDEEGARNGEGAAAAVDALLDKAIEVAVAFGAKQAELLAPMARIGPRVARASSSTEDALDSAVAAGAERAAVDDAAPPKAGASTAAGTMTVAAPSRRDNASHGVSLLNNRTSHGGSWTSPSASSRARRASAGAAASTTSAPRASSASAKKKTPPPRGRPSDVAPHRSNWTRCESHDEYRALLVKHEAKIADLRERLITEGTAREKAEAALEEERTWNGYVSQLLEYRKEKGDCNVPGSYGGGKNGSLGWWVKRVRRQRQDQDAREGGTRREGSLLSDERIRVLESIDFAWSGQKRRGPRPKPLKEIEPPVNEDAIWGSFLSQLLRYRAETGDCLVPRDHEGGKKGSLAWWVRHVRQLRNEQEIGLRVGGFLTEDRIKVLQSIDFVWTVTRSRKPGEAKKNAGDEEEDHKTFDHFFALLLEHKAEKGHCKVSMTEGGGKAGSLGYWAKRLRSLRREQEKGKGTRSFPTEEQVQRLDSIGFVWSRAASDPEEIFEERFAELLEFKAQHGHTCVVYGKSKLGKWVHYQRDRYRELQKKRKWIEEHGSLDGWGRSKGRSAMAPEEEARLNAIGFVWDTRPRKPLGWDGQFAELVAYRNEHGHCHVPQSYKGNQNLGRWVMRQRVRYGHLKKGIISPNSKIMTPERIQKLESIGFCWNRVEAKATRVQNDGESTSSDEEEQEEDNGGYLPRETHGLWPH